MQVQYINLSNMNTIPNTNNLTPAPKLLLGIVQVYFYVMCVCVSMCLSEKNKDFQL